MAEKKNFALTDDDLRDVSGGRGYTDKSIDYYKNQTCPKGGCHDVYYGHLTMTTGAAGPDAYICRKCNDYWIPNGMDL